MTKPNFLIIGAQRCGTTSMYNYLIQNPRINSASSKEIHFFDNNFQKGLEWYLKQFPPEDSQIITGEATPYYIFHPLAPERISKNFPKVKIIILLRDPIKRAYSHYWHEKRLGFEKLSFVDAIKEETKRLEGEVEKILEDKKYYSFNHQNYSYLKRGIYWEQIDRWYKLFPKENFCIIRSEDFYEKPQEIVNKTEIFLNVPIYSRRNFETFNKGDYLDMDERTLAELKQFFKPHNEKLYKILNRNMNWE